MATGTMLDDTMPLRAARVGTRLDTPRLMMIVLAVVLALITTTAVVALLAPATAEALGRNSAAAAARNSASAREIYAGLADTDVAAGALFLAENETARAGLVSAYVTTVDRVQRTLSAAQVDARGDPARQFRLTAIADELRVYRQVVDDGTIAGFGFDFAVQAVLASAYAREASHYMADVVLPSVRRLNTDDHDRLADARQDGRRWLAAAVTLPILSLFALAASQWWLWRRTRRRLNAGLLIASGTVVAVLGLLIASLAHWPSADAGFATVAVRMDAQDRTQQQLGSLLSGRADVYLALGSSVDPDAHQRDFTARGLCGAAADGKVDCSTLESVWEARQSGNAAKYSGAVRTVQATGAVAAEFDAAARSLTDRLAHGERDVDAAVRRLPPAAPQHRVLIPTLLAIAAITASCGLLIRLVEYY